MELSRAIKLNILRHKIIRVKKCMLHQSIFANFYNYEAEHKKGYQIAALGYSALLDTLRKNQRAIK